MTRRESATNNSEGKEVPCLTSSDTSHDILSSSLDDILSTDTSCQSDGEAERVIVLSRRIIDRSKRSALLSRQQRGSLSPQRSAAASKSTSQHRSRSRPKVSLSERSRSPQTSTAAPTPTSGHRSRSRPKVEARRRSNSRPRSVRQRSRSPQTSIAAPTPTSEHRSRSRPKVEARRRSSSRPRSVRQRSRSRPISSAPVASRLGTVQRLPYISQLDAFLQTGSGLRLETNGKCTFLFEGQRFVIEAEGKSTGDFLFYASLGPLKKLQQINRPKNLLRLMASWNEDLKERSGGAQDQEEGRESSGLLRIDSSIPDGPHVAFIYYGHLDNIVNAAHFQDKLDEFVDDSMEYSHKILGTKGKTGYRISRSCSPSSHSSVDSDNVRSKLSRDAKTSDRKNTNEPTILQDKSATLSTPATASTATISTNTTTQNSSPEVASSTTASKTSFFTKVISSVHRPHINLGYQEQDCFVIDRQEVEEGNAKPTIVLSRAGEKREDISKIGEQHNVRRGSSFYDCCEQHTVRKGSSFHDRGEQHTVRKGSSFHDRGEQHAVKKGSTFHDRGEQHTVRKGPSFHDRGEQHTVRKGASFHYRGSANENRREYYRRGKGRSFHTADDENICQVGGSAHGKMLPSSPAKPLRTTSVHIDNGRDASEDRFDSNKSSHPSDNEIPNNTNLTKIKTSLHSSYMEDRLQPEGITRAIGHMTKCHSSVDNDKSNIIKGSVDPQHQKRSHRSSCW